ncbi:MAG TPA: aminoacyl-tRNA hydrolase [Nitrososphaera sp.]|nr:aminoacyl-tRNA hydrolase [Nitrososphaera sp.]
MSELREAKQIIVMRKDLNMRKGKMIAQGSHASIAFLTNRLLIESEADEGTPWIHAQLGVLEAEKAWIEGRFTKICVGVDSHAELIEVYNAATAAGITAHLITDAGLTEFKEPTVTCAGIGPAWSDDLDKITGHLKLL